MIGYILSNNDECLPTTTSKDQIKALITTFLLIKKETCLFTGSCFQLPEVLFLQRGCRVWYRRKCTKTKTKTCAHQFYLATHAIARDTAKKYRVGEYTVVHQQIV